MPGHSKIVQALCLLVISFLLTTLPSSAAGADRPVTAAAKAKVKKAKAKMKKAKKKKTTTVKRCTTTASAKRKRTKKVARKRSATRVVRARATAAASKRKRTTRKRSRPARVVCKTPKPKVPSAAPAPIAPSLPQAAPVAVTPAAPAAPVRVAAAAEPEPVVTDAPVPPDFFGIVADAASATHGRARAQVLETIKRTGAGTIRHPFRWQDLERAPGQWDWKRLDQYVADTARQGIELLPILFGAPDFAARTDPDGTRSGGFYPPADNAAFADFASRAVRRYGHDGSFWRAHPVLPYRPVTAWEVWNEPNGGEFWRTGVDGADYARLLIAASAAIKAADPQALVVSGGLPAMGGPNDAIHRYLEAMYQAGAGPAMDAVGLHPYAPSPQKALAIIAEARQVMARHGDAGKRIWVTEYGYATGAIASDYTKSEADQAAAIVETTRLLARYRDHYGIGKLVYYSLSDLPVWPGGEEFWGLNCGLFRIDGQPKPAATAVAGAIAGLTGKPAQSAPTAIPDLRDIVAGRVDNGGVQPY